MVRCFIAVTQAKLNFFLILPFFNPSVIICQGVQIILSICFKYHMSIFTVCSQQYRQEEIDFLIKNFVDNGYLKHELVSITNEFRRKRDNLSRTKKEIDPKQIVVLPWVSGLQNYELRRQY